MSLVLLPYVHFEFFTDVPISATKEIQRSKRASDVTRSRLSSVTRATDNDVCVHRFVKFAGQKSFSG